MTTNFCSNLNIEFSGDSELKACIVQDYITGEVLMLGYMNSLALQRTKELGKVTFFSRSKGRLWTKGESSGNYLMVVSIHRDCDGDAILILADPTGPVCHEGTRTCFGDRVLPQYGFLGSLERLIKSRKNGVGSPLRSYTAKLFTDGIARIAQKVGEEAVELVIEAMDDADIDKFKGEAADLLFHYLVLMREKGVEMEEIIEILRSRNQSA